MSEKQRKRLTRDRVIEGAVALADDIGVEALTMRKLAEALDVKPMTIYHHVDNKEQIIDGMVDSVFAEIDLPPAELGWKQAIRARCLSARAVLSRHKWAAPLMETRTSPGQATLTHHDAMIGCFRSGGMSLQMTAHAYAVVDSFVYGFAIQQANLPFLGDEPATSLEELAGAFLESFPEGAYPHFVDFTVNHALQPGYAFGDSFEFGLDVILDGLERRTAGTHQ